MENRRISEYDPMPTGIEDTDLFETARPSTANYKASWSFLRGELSNFFSALLHSTRHQVGGADVLNVTGLSGDLADPQTPKTHSATHGVTGPDSLNVTGLSGELADPQPPKTHDNTAHSATYITDTVEHGNEKHSPNFSQIGLATGQIDSLTEKTTPVADDILIIEDSAASMAGKKIKMSNLPPSEDIEMVVTNMTYGETIAINDALYMADDGKVYKTDATDVSKSQRFIGFAKESGNANDVKKVQIGGKVTGFTGLTVGYRYFLSDTGGAISLSQGTNTYFVGLAISSTELFVIRDYKQFKTVASATLRHSNDTSRTTTSTSLVKLKEILIKEPLDAYRVSFSLGDFTGNSWQATGRIYLNGSAFGTSRTSSSASPGETFNQDFTTKLKVGDLLQVYASRNASGGNGGVANFRILYDTQRIDMTHTNQDPA